MATIFTKVTTVSPVRIWYWSHRADLPDEAAFEKLCAEIPTLHERIWVLYCRGDGYLEAVSSEPRMHYLRYPVPSEEVLGKAEILCFRNALKLLAGAAEVTPSDFWGAFYPPDNVAVVTLFTLLAVRDRFEVASAISAFAADPDARTAYLQYCRASSLFTQGAAWPYERWTAGITGDHPGALLDELRRVLGHAPD